MEEYKLPEIHLDLWEYDDRTIGGRLQRYPDGEIQAMTMPLMVKGLQHILKALVDAKLSKQKQGVLKLDMQGQWIDGRFAIRFRYVKGFGISFSNVEGMAEWLKIFSEGIEGIEQIKNVHD